MPGPLWPYLLAFGFAMLGPELVSIFSWCRRRVGLLPGFAPAVSAKSTRRGGGPPSPHEALCRELERIDREFSQARVYDLHRSER